MNIFISYADKDTSYLTELTARLTVLQRTNSFTFWSKQNLIVGDSWKTIINDKLTNADIILILVSTDALASDHVYDEITQAILQSKLGKSIIIPIILRSCIWKDTILEEVSQYCIATVPIANQDNKDEAWTNIIKGISEYLTK
jgi:hypothetical protein